MHMKYLALSCIVLFPLFFCCRKNGGSGTLFTLLPAKNTGVGFSNQLEESERFNIIKYLYYYNGGGVATGDVNNDGLPDLYFTANQGPDKLYLNKGNLKFQDITGQAGLSVAAPGPETGTGTTHWKTGVTFADVNGDGWLDIYVCEIGHYKSVSGRNRLFINNGISGQRAGVTFTERAESFGLDFKGFSQQAAFFDYDRDGDLDMYLLNNAVHSSESFVLATQRTQRDSLSGDRLYRNDGGHFTDVSAAAGIFGGSMGYGLGVVVSDLNNDGWPDIYATNDFHENDYLYRNNHDGTFTESIAAATGHNSTFSMGVDAADCNNDGLPDLLTLDMQPADDCVLKMTAGTDPYNLQRMKLDYGYHFQYPRNMLQVNCGPSGESPFTFLETGQMAGIAATDWSWSGLFADLDNDGWKDVFITNGIPHRPNDLDYLKFASDAEVQRSVPDDELASKMAAGIAPNYAFRNQLVDSPGERFPIFKNVSKEWGLDLNGYSNGAAFADLDNDGDLDLVVNNLYAPASIYRNNSEAFGVNNFLKIKLEGEGMNRFGIGARVTIIAAGMAQTLELSPTRGWLSSVDYVLNFGTGVAATVDEITVHWPDGRQQVLSNIPANQTLTFRQSDSQHPSPPALQSQAIPPIHQSLIPNSQFLHSENRFVDFNIEPLLPHQLSTQGPKIAVAGVNGDGAGDFFLCGAKGQAGQLFLSGENGIFQKKIIADFEKDFLREDVGATFFDADGDADADLFVVSGGGEYRAGAAPLQDRLYLNDGKGNFSKSDKTAWPATNGACAVAAGFDGGGAIGLFIGSRSVTGSYGLTPPSFIFLNDGAGRFHDATAALCPGLNTAGMVTAAVWLPGEHCLVVAGEWMPITIFDFSKTPAARVTLPGTSGWWNSLAAADMDGDGDLDLLAGNLGLNTCLTASPTLPTELFVKDFDENGTTDPILTYYRQGKRYTVAGLDELAAQLPMLRKRFVEYRTFASSSFDEVFTTEMRKGAVHKKAETFESAYFENLGNGEFKMKPLPLTAQTAPIHAFLPGDFDGDGKMDALAVGNFYENTPGIGRCDASHGWFLKGDGAGHFTSLPAAESGFVVAGQGRDVKLVTDGAGRQHILVARNNGAVLVGRIMKH